MWFICLLTRFLLVFVVGVKRRVQVHTFIYWNYYFNENLIGCWHRLPDSITIVQLQTKWLITHIFVVKWVFFYVGTPNGQQDINIQSVSTRFWSKNKTHKYAHRIMVIGYSHVFTILQLVSSRGSTWQEQQLKSEKIIQFSRGVAIT